MLDKYRARGLINLYGSLPKGTYSPQHSHRVAALKEIYPEHHWIDNKFKKPHRYWNDLGNQRKFFDTLAKKLSIHEKCMRSSLFLCITSPESWYRVTKQDVMDHGGGGFLTKYYRSSVIRALATVYPTYSWKYHSHYHHHLGPHISKGQGILTSICFAYSRSWNE